MMQVSSAFMVNCTCSFCMFSIWQPRWVLSLRRRGQVKQYFVFSPIFWIWTAYPFHPLAVNITYCTFNMQVMTIRHLLVHWLHPWWGYLFKQPKANRGGKVTDRFCNTIWWCHCLKMAYKINVNNHLSLEVWTCSVRNRGSMLTYLTVNVLYSIWQFG